ncbi:uncharacterized protein LOC120906507 [Anopheles arabiensis]|uniref:uncharacterized protein LOC120906507 n=1 Tax=Anopheles arabiensis TaxID=7173 RepID=UPI001AAD023F|nr:uncharacterized protein LOC120906507 [Anopheles arabiensis]
MLIRLDQPLPARSDFQVSFPVTFTRTVSVPVSALCPAHLPAPLLHPDAVHHLVLYRRPSLRFPSHHNSHNWGGGDFLPSNYRYDGGIMLQKMYIGNQHGLWLLWLCLNK